MSLGVGVASVEIIALLCAGSTAYHGLPGGGSTGDRLSRLEIAGLLSGLNKAAMNLALAKYALDLDAERGLIAHVRCYAAGLAVKEKWHIVKGRPVLCNMAALAVFEAVRPNRCVRCSGRGMLGHRVCISCNGTGYKALSGRQVAEGIGVDEQSFRRVWRARFDGLYSYLHGIESEVSRVLYASDHERGLLAC
jgi:hypothetical protein